MSSGPHFSIEFVSEALGLSEISKSYSESGFSRVQTDSRQIKRGDLFVPLKGDNFDGHQFIEQAINAGASGVLCEATRPLSVPNSVFLFRVRDTLEAYRSLAFAWRRRFEIPVIVVAGSVGKTTTKEFLAAILKGHFSNVHRTKDSFNGFIGIPMTLLELRSSHDVAVIEVGIDDVGAMKKHLELIAPTHAIVTAIGPEHLDRLRDLKTVAYEEGLTLVMTGESGGKCALNLDEPLLRDLSFVLPKRRTIGFTTTKSDTSVNQPLDLVRGEYSHGHVRLYHNEKIFGDFQISVLGQHNARNFAGAASVAIQLGLKFEDVQRGLTHFEPPWGRSEIRTLKSGVHVFCDFYNANPTSMVASIGAISDYRVQHGHRGNVYLCLGDMLELGEEELNLHRELSEPLVALGAAHIYLYGERMKVLYQEIISKVGDKVSHHFDLEEVGRQLVKTLGGNDLILIKGSRGMKMERIWDYLKEM